MAYYCRVDKKTKLVLFVHTINNNDCMDENGNENELTGIAYLKKIHANQPWIDKCIFVKTSYNNNIRKNYAGIGYLYDEITDRFVPPKPTGDNWRFDDENCKWVLNETK